MKDPFSEMHDGSVVTDLAKGAIAGAAATWLMGRATTFLYERESEQARSVEIEARGGNTSYGIAAQRVAGSVGGELTDEELEQAGSALHWALGVGAGATYGMMRRRGHGSRAGRPLRSGPNPSSLGACSCSGCNPEPSRRYQRSAGPIVSHS